jgi:hypothetical protein
LRRRGRYRCRFLRIRGTCSRSSFRRSGSRVRVATSIAIRA